MVWLTLETIGVDKVVGELKLLEGRVLDLRPVFGLLQEEFYKIERDLFRSQGDTGEHGGWPEITEDSRRRRAYTKDHQGMPGDPDAPVLHSTGELEASLTRGNAYGARRIFTRNTMAIGSRLEKGKLVAAKDRRPIDFTLDQKAFFVAQIDEYLMGRMRI